jgi:putative transposase
MNTRDIAGEYRLAHWAQVMRDRTDKGLSIRAYCEEARIHENTYFYWQRKLRETACAGIQAATAEVKAVVPKGWATVGVNESPMKAQGLTIEVSGCRITVNADTDPELLIQVCRALKTV